MGFSRDLKTNIQIEDYIKNKMQKTDIKQIKIK